MKLKLLIFSLLIFNSLIGASIIYKRHNDQSALYFMYVGQGDSELINLGKAKIMIDGGPDYKTEGELSKIIGNDPIDISIITHPHNDHFLGLREVINKRKIRMILWSGISGGNKDFKELMELADKNKIKVMTVRRGSEIKYLNNRLSILSPGEKELADKKLSTNSKSIAMLLYFSRKQAFYGGDLDSIEEENLERKYGFTADILKVSHHGSSKSTSQRFLSLLKPKMAVISDGRRNVYRFPTKEVLKRLSGSGAIIYRLDELGSIKITEEKGSLKTIKLN